MFTTKGSSAARLAVAAGLVAVMATAGLGVAVAAPKAAPAKNEVHLARSAGGNTPVEAVVDDALPPVLQPVEIPAGTPAERSEASDPPEEDTTSTAVTAGNTGSPSSPQQERSGEVDQVVPTAGDFDVERLRELPAEGTDGGDVAEGGRALGGEVIARIQACVGSVVDELDSATESAGAGPGSGAGQSLATSVVEDALPCVAELVEDALDCVGGLVERALDAAMTMDIDGMAELAGVLVDELVDCVGAGQSG